MDKSDRKKADRGYEDFYGRMPDMVDKMIRDWRASAPAWPVLSPAKIHRVWDAYAATGSVDDSALDEIYTSLRDNVLRLQISNILGDHEAIPGRDLTEDSLSEKEHETFSSWVVDDSDGNWRISDYGLPQLIDCVAFAHVARYPSEKLRHLDNLLNIVHCRGDLALLFVEGGRKSVNQLPEIEIPGETQKPA